MPNLSSSRPLSLRAVLIVAALALIFTLAWRPLAIPDEGRYLGVAAAMWDSGDWVVPRLDGLPFFHKPPLFYWIAAPLYGLTGGVTWVGRAASWLGAMIGALALAWLVRARRADAPDDDRAIWAVAALCAQPLWFLGAQYANLDMLVAGCITLAICGLALHEFDANNRSARWIGFAAMAIGVLAKGLIGVVLPVGVLALWLAWERRFRGWLRLAWIPGWALFTALTAPWFIAVEMRHPGFAHYFFIVQHFQRYTATGFNNMQPGWFFIGVLLVAALPWSPWGTMRLASVLRRAPLQPSPDAAASLDRLGVTWLVLITLFFSLPPSKLVGYIFPAVPALALLASGPAAAWAQRSRRTLSLPFALALAGLAVCVAAVALAARLDRKGNEALAIALRSQWHAGDALVYDEAYFFDLALLLGRHADVPVLLQWSDPHAVQGDGWERELADAGRFDPARSATVLRDPAQWSILRCAAPRTWLIARRDARTPAIESLHQTPRVRTAHADAYLVERTGCTDAQ
jgi:4-amino-4-deoxy-L-arabinose transferase-like glycosyltransferase